MIVNVFDSPEHPSFTGDTVMVATIGAEVLFVVVWKEGIFPEPEAAKPMAGFEFDQLYVVLLKNPVKFISPDGSPAHFTILLIVLTVGRGLTIKGVVCVEVPHPLVTDRLMLLVTGALVVFVNCICPGIC